MTMRSADLFSRVAAEYARFRPRYPAELFRYLVSQVPALDLAWDCGTGNGQAAVVLADHFSRVYASDASPDQIALAPPHPRIEYHVQPVEQVALASASVDLVTAAVAVHWFELVQFYQEVRRVLKPEGVIAVWTYHLPTITPPVDAVLLHYYENVVGGFWPPGFHLVHERYETLPFPFLEFQPPRFGFESRWSLEQVAGFLASWSATAAYLERTGEHPLNRVWNELLGAWGDPSSVLPIRWPLHLRIGRRG